jgi:Predicted transcriptional regulator containing an HTH domain and an uncharacterized domain shared with the mammalian protein Schlafen
MIKFKALNTAKNTITANNDAKNTATDSKNKAEENILVVFEYLNKHPDATQKSIMENLNLSRRTTERIMFLLKEKKYIERVGNNRLGYWKILK